MQPAKTYTPIYYAPSVNGYITLKLGGRTRTIIGGPFDAWTGQGIGVCLEAASRLAPKADVLIPVDDFKAPTQEQLQTGVLQLLAIARDSDEPIYVGCRGGIGRTGTFIAVLAKIAGDAAPLAYVRHFYLSHAIETKGQADAVGEFDIGPAIGFLRPTLFEKMGRFLTGIR